MKKLLLLLILLSFNVHAVDISKPINLLFAADKKEKFIDVIDINKQEVVYRIETEHMVDGLLATPYAPILVYTNKKEKIMVFYNLETKQFVKTLSLPMTPRHIVLDTVGNKIGISDSVDGGFVLISAFEMEIKFSLENFPPTTDVLFDPNEVDIYYTDNTKGVLGLIDIPTQKRYEMPLEQPGKANFSSPSRSLDGMYIYVANNVTGEIYSLNIYARKIHNKFDVGQSPVRPYTSPEGSFLYMMDQKTGRFVAIEQGPFTEYNDTNIGEGIDLVTVGRFDRMNLFVSSENNKYYIYDNLTKQVVSKGELAGIPLDAQSSLDGKTAFIAFRDTPKIAAVNMEAQLINYINATENGARTYRIGLSNQVCHWARRWYTS